MKTWPLYTDLLAFKVFTLENLIKFHGSFIFDKKKRPTASSGAAK